MNKRINLITLLIIILAISNISAIRINEVEMNPEGTDAGNEWIEFYSEEEINLEDYKLINNDENEIILNESFSGYYIYTFSKQWLDNIDEKIFLYKNNELIDETILLEDSKNNDLTWQFCGDWQFLEATKEEENNCEETQEEVEKETLEEPEETEEENNEISEVIEDFKEESNIKKPITFDTINLNPKNPKDIKSSNGEEKSEKSNSNYAIYGFIAFCILIAVLFMLKLRRKKLVNSYKNLKKWKKKKPEELKQFLYLKL